MYPHNGSTVHLINNATTIAATRAINAIAIAATRAINTINTTTIAALISTNDPTTIAAIIVHAEERNLTVTNKPRDCTIHWTFGINHVIIPEHYESRYDDPNSAVVAVPITADNGNGTHTISRSVFGEFEGNSHATNLVGHSARNGNRTNSSRDA